MPGDGSTEGKVARQQADAAKRGAWPLRGLVNVIVTVVKLYIY